MRSSWVMARKRARDDDGRPVWCCRQDGHSHPEKSSPASPTTAWCTLTPARTARPGSAHTGSRPPLDTALRESEIVVLALPDRMIGGITKQIVPALKPGTLVVCLDVAAPYAGALPERADITCFVVHPCHPPLASDEVEPEARADFFGGTAKQGLVCALMQGPEEDYARGEALARRMSGPVLRTHRVTLERIALMEPIMVEMVGLSCVGVLREAMDEAIRHGVPAEAARDFDWPPEPGTRPLLRPYRGPGFRWRQAGDGQRHEAPLSARHGFCSRLMAAVDRR